MFTSPVRIEDGGFSPSVSYRKRAIVGLQSRCPQDASMFDPVQAPSLRHAFELVSAAIPETDSGLRHQILDRA
jgi:hypothetical protein